jgi:hypothetical protein
MKDKIGIWTSVICLIHCLFFPLLATVFPIFLDIDWKVEVILLILALVVGSLSFIDNIFKHKYFLSIIFFLLGFLFIFVGVIFSVGFFHFIGLITLITAHYLNFKKIKQTDGCHPHGCNH